MRNECRLFTDFVLTALIVVALAATIAAEEPQKITDSTSVGELKALAANGNADAMLSLGERLVQGQGVDTNAVEGLRWIQKAAEGGNAGAWYDLGMMYANGIGVATDMTKAMEYLRKGAEKGNAECQAGLGLFYQAGERIPGGVKADPAEAVKWYILAAEQNQQEAIFHLARLYLNGEGVKADSAEAVKWFTKGAEAGNPDAQWMLGMCYRKGAGVEKDNVQAYALISAAVDGAQDPEQKKGMAEARDKIKVDLTPEQLKTALLLIEKWKSNQPK